MKKNRSVFIIAIVVFLAFSAGLAWRWVQGTPYYAMYQIGAGLKNRDLNTVLTYIDLDSVLNQQVSGTLSALLSNLASSSPLAKMTGPLGEIKIQLTPGMNQGLKELAAGYARRYLENTQNPTLPSSFFLLYLAHFEIKEDSALVTLKYEKDQLRLGLRKQEGIWRVVEINAEDAQRLVKTYLLPPSR
jgi:hypothetical protein